MIMKLVYPQGGMTVDLDMFLPTTNEKFERFLKVIGMTFDDDIHAQELSTYLSEAKQIQEYEMKEEKSRKKPRKTRIKAFNGTIKNLDRHIRDLGKWAEKNGISVGQNSDQQEQMEGE